MKAKTLEFSIDITSAFAPTNNPYERTAIDDARDFASFLFGIGCEYTVKRDYQSGGDKFIDFTVQIDDPDHEWMVNDQWRIICA